MRLNLIIAGFLALLSAWGFNLLAWSDRNFIPAALPAMYTAVGLMGVLLFLGFKLKDKSEVRCDG